MNTKQLSRLLLFLCFSLACNAGPLSISTRRIIIQEFEMPEAVNLEWDVDRYGPQPVPDEGQSFGVVTVKLKPDKSIGKYDYTLSGAHCLAIAENSNVFDPATRPVNYQASGDGAPQVIKLLYLVNKADPAWMLEFKLSDRDPKIPAFNLSGETTSQAVIGTVPVDGAAGTGDGVTLPGEVTGANPAGPDAAATAGGNAVDDAADIPKLTEPEMNVGFQEPPPEVVSAVAALELGIILVVVGILLVMHLFCSFCALKICQKCGEEPGCLVWIPLLQLIPLSRVAGVSPVLIIILTILILTIPIAGILLFVKLCEAREKSGVLVLLLFVPGIGPLLLLLILAFTD